MTPRPDIVAVPADAPLPDALRTANTHGLSRLPVYDRDLDNVVGVLHVRDGVAGLLDDVSPSDLRTLARPTLVIPESKFVDRLLREMQAANIHLAIVVNEYGDTAGLVTIEDLLEEIVGEIEDEYDTADTPIEHVAPGQARVAGSLPIADLNDELSLALPISDVHTIGGLAFSAFGRVPTVGDAVTVAGRPPARPGPARHPHHPPRSHPARPHRRLTSRSRIRLTGRSVSFNSRPRRVIQSPAAARHQ